LEDKDGRDEREVIGDRSDAVTDGATHASDDELPASDAAEVPPNEPVETGTVPAFLGLFNDEPAPRTQSVAVAQESAPTVSSGTAPESTDTDSVRIFAEMFRGFRRRSTMPPEPGPADVGADDGTDDEADAETIDDVDNDEATGAIAVAAPAADFAAVISGSTTATTHTSKENDVSTSEPSGPATARPIKTTYVPSDASNQTEQALAWLAAENVASGQAPAIG